jgi:integrase/recombinase XerD
MTYEQTMEKLQMDLQLRRFSEGTITCYNYTLNRFLDTVDKSDKNNLDEFDFRSYLYSLHQTDLNARTINNYNSAIRFLYEVTLEKDINYKRVPYAKIDTYQPTFFSPDEILKLFDGISSAKHLAFYLNLYGSGLRISEMLSLKTEDILKSKMLLRVRSGKGRKERFTPLTEAGYQAFRLYWKQYSPENSQNYVFPDYTKTRPMSSQAFSSALNKIAKKADFHKPTSPHAFRHSFATHMLQSGTEFIALKEMLGHRSVTSTALYLHLSLVDTSNNRSPSAVCAQIKARYDKRMNIRG